MFIIGNTAFWMFFFMIGLVATIDMITDFGDAVAMRLFRRVFDNTVIVAVYVLLLLVAIDALRMANLTYSWTANALRGGALIYTSTRMTKTLVHAAFMVGAFLTFFPFWGGNVLLMLGLACFMLLLLGLSLYAKWVRAKTPRYVSALVLLSAYFWLFCYVADQYPAWQTIAYFVIFVAEVLLTVGYDYLLKFRQGRNRRWRYSSNHDELTSVRSLSLFRKDYGTYQTMMRAEHKNLHLVMVDIDHFKEINDTFGHLVGNEVLQRFAHDLDEYLVAMPYYCGIYRTGGEEFSLLFYSQTTHQVRTAVAAYVGRLQRLLVMGVNPDRRITLSIGITQVEGSHEGLTAAVQRADSNLYLAKKKGRNTIVVA